MNFKENFKNMLTDEATEKLIKNLNLANARTIRNYANGTREPNLKQLEIIVKTLNCSYDDLLK